MKKWLLILGMIIALSSVTACGMEKADESAAGGSNSSIYMTQEMADNYVNQIISIFDTLLEDGQSEQLSTNEVYYSAITNWEGVVGDIGECQSIDNVMYYTTDGTEGEKMVITADITCSEGTATFEAVFLMDVSGGGFMEESITFDVNRTFGELMANAGMNTLIGMLTVFSVLILISLIISCFQYIPAVEEFFKKRKAKKAIQNAVESVDGAVAQIVENELLQEEDDMELAAVIAAAVAAYEGSSGDGYVVRSIRRVR